jgi:hypothetical protein
LAAFNVAVNRNTFEAFGEYLGKYPQSKLKKEARQKYDSLLYLTKTSGQQLSDYIQFLNEFPETPYRGEIELNIFQLSTATGTTEAFSSMSRTNNPYATVAAAVLKELEYHVSSDSVDDASVLYPVLRNGLFGILNHNGSEVHPASITDLPDSYRCGNIRDEIIALPDKVINHNGQTTWEGKYDAVEALGYGFVSIEHEGKMFVVHNTGLRFYRSPVDDVRLLSGRVFAIHQEGHWGVLTLTGRIIVKPEWDDIDVIGDVLVMRKNNKISLTTIDNITRQDRGQKKWVDGFDAVKKIGDNLLWVQSGSYEGVLDTTLNILIRLDKHQVTSTSQGFLLTTSSGQSLVNQRGDESEQVQRIDVKGAWIGCKKDNKWYLMDPVTLRRRQESYDSIQFMGTFAIGLRSDSVTVWTARNRLVREVQPVAFEFLPGQDSTGFLVISDQKRQTVYSSVGVRLFTGSFDRILAGGQDHFIIQKKDRQKKEKKGLINLQGKEILPAEYDAIVGPADGVMSLLKGRKFGQYDLHSKLLIKPEYDKNIQRYSRGIYCGIKDNKHGFIDAKNKPLTEFIFDEVIHWTDSIVLVRSGKIWTLLNFRSGKAVSQPFSEVKMIRDDAVEKIYRIRQGNSYGVISNRVGLIIPVRFTDLVNVGSPRHPVYFTEKHVEEASLYVVIYYDAHGKFIRKEVYEQDDYERIYCSR